MTITKARDWALHVSSKSARLYAVVYDPSYRDELPEDSYWLSDEEDLCTWFNGAKVVAYYEDGKEVE